MDSDSRRVSASERRPDVKSTMSSLAKVLDQRREVALEPQPAFSPPRLYTRLFPSVLFAWFHFPHSPFWDGGLSTAQGLHLLHASVSNVEAKRASWRASALTRARESCMFKLFGTMGEGIMLSKGKEQVAVSSLQCVKTFRNQFARSASFEKTLSKLSGRG